MKRMGSRLLVILFALLCFSVGAQSERVANFQVKPEDGAAPVNVRLQSTASVSSADIELLQRTMRVSRLDGIKEAERSLFVAEGKKRTTRLDPQRAQIKVDVTGRKGERWAWSWPDAFTFVSPGIVEVTTPSKTAPRKSPAAGERIGIVHESLLAAPRAVIGRIVCQGDPVPFISVAIESQGATTDINGAFRIDHEFSGIPATVFIAFDGTAQVGALAIPIQIMDDAHFARSERVDRDPTVTGDTADFADIEVPGTDCRLWRRAFLALQRYEQIMGSAPPAGQLRIKRWEAVPLSVGAPHTYYDYIVAPTDMAVVRPDTVFHEFGHTIAFGADGSKAHWDWDNTRFIYARTHGATTVANKGLAFIEGWADYWLGAHQGVASIVDASGLPSGFLDFNEDQIATRLMNMAQAIPVAPGAAVDTRHKFMVDLFINNPGVLHTLQQFEAAYCAALAVANAFCAGGASSRTAPSCPPGYTDDGLTCRKENILAKPSQGRGVGAVPTNCGPGKELDAGLCYPLCPAGMRGVGPVCWQICPPGYNDDGATCRRDGSIFGSNNSACPWYDKCGLVTAKGCSVCPAGFNNDGCTCRRDPHIFGKSTHARGVGTPPSACRAGLQYDAGLCYAMCPAGFNGVGPVCWGTCPAGFADHGATCYSDPHIFPDDPVAPP